MQPAPGAALQGAGVSHTQELEPRASRRGQSRADRGQSQPALHRHLPVDGAAPARELYEEFYCARGECENRIKEAQLDLFADRLSAATFRANQLRLWLASAAYVLMHALRRVGLTGTALARACANTIRLRLLKIGAVVTVSVRRVKLAMSEACANQREFIAAFHALSAAAR